MVPDRTAAQRDRGAGRAPARNRADGVIEVVQGEGAAVVQGHGAQAGPVAEGAGRARRQGAGVDDGGARIAVGAGKRLEDGKIAPLDVKKGDRILFGKYSGSEIRLDGEEYLILRESDIMGIVQ